VHTKAGVHTRGDLHSIGIGKLARPGPPQDPLCGRDVPTARSSSACVPHTWKLVTISWPALEFRQGYSPPVLAVAQRLLRILADGNRNGLDVLVAPCFPRRQLTNFRQHTDKRGRVGIVLETLTSPSQHLTHPGKFGFEAVSFRAEAVDFVFDFGPALPLVTTTWISHHYLLDREPQLRFDAAFPHGGQPCQTLSPTS
jgi:hypothetical protein